MRSLCLPFALAACAGAAALLPGLAAAQDRITEYTAEYEVHYKGRRVARAEFGVTADAGGHYTFSASTRARGLLRLASPNPAVERSRFRVEDGSIRPSRFEFEDGSRRGEDNFAVEFDAAANEVRLTTSAGTTTLPGDAGLLDRGSLQVALMRELGACELPGPYRYVDDDGVRTYRYERIEDLPAETGIGALATVRFSQEREGSSRRTILWLAPDLAYLPVRIEQIRDGEIETVFSLESVAGIEREASGCSGFR